MPLTPVEIRHVKLRRGVLGYSRASVDGLVDDVVTSFEEVWRERADLADRIEQLESELGRYRDLEGLLRATLVTAERAATELREQAQREADLIVSEAHAARRSITREAAAEREHLTAEARRVRTILRAALAAVEEAGVDDGAATAQAA
jgi:cell division initiation protein